jgi:hypothetical protein
MIGSLTPVIFKISHLDRPCSSPDSTLESGEERYVYRTLIVGVFESGAPILRSTCGILSANGCPDSQPYCFVFDRSALESNRLL